MSGFYSKMLINIRNLYFNNSDDMKTILHGIFLDAADVFLNGYTPSYCEENELMEDYNVFVHSNKDSKDSGAPLAFASFCDDYPNREWTIFHI